MDLGTVLVLLAIILAAVSYFIDTHAHRLLTAAVVVGFVGVLVGAGGLTT